MLAPVPGSFLRCYPPLYYRSQRILSCSALRSASAVEVARPLLSLSTPLHFSLPQAPSLHSLHSIHSLHSLLSSIAVSLSLAPSKGRLRARLIELLTRASLLLRVASTPHTPPLLLACSLADFTVRPRQQQQRPPPGHH